MDPAYAGLVVRETEGRTRHSVSCTRKRNRHALINLVSRKHFTAPGLLISLERDNVRYNAPVSLLALAVAIARDFALRARTSVAVHLSAMY